MNSCQIALGKIADKISDGHYPGIIYTKDCLSSSSRSLMFFKIGVLKNFVIFSGNHLRWSLFLILVLGLPNEANDTYDLLSHILLAYIIFIYQKGNT